MAIPGITQPGLIQIGDGLRLRKYDGRHDFALRWYQDTETVYMVDGVREPYTPEKLDRMYAYLERQGELYFIELLENGAYRPIGDVTFWQEDMPIVIGEKACRGRGIGRKVVAALVERGRSLGYQWLKVNEIYGYNTASAKCFESVGFTVCGHTEKGFQWKVEL